MGQGLAGGIGHLIPHSLLGITSTSTPVAKMRNNRKGEMENKQVPTLFNVYEKHKNYYVVRERGRG